MLTHIKISLTVVVPFRGKLNEPEEQRRELVVVHVLLASWAIGTNTETLGLFLRNVQSRLVYFYSVNGSS